MKLYELQQGGDIDSQLDRVARSVGKQATPGSQNGLGPQSQQSGNVTGGDPMSDGALGGTNGAANGASQGPMDGTDQSDPNEPEMPVDAGNTDDDLTVEKTKAVDDLVMASVQGHPFWNYSFRNVKVTPDKILQMELPDLNNLRTMVRSKISMNSLKDQIGLWDRPDMNYYRDFISFLDKVISARKQAVKQNDPSDNRPVRRPKVAQQEEPKNNKMREFKPKRIPN